MCVCILYKHTYMHIFPIRHDVAFFFVKVLKCLNQFIQNFSSLFKSEFEGMFSPQVELLGICLVL